MPRTSDDGGIQLHEDGYKASFDDVDLQNWDSLGRQQDRSGRGKLRRVLKNVLAWQVATAILAFALAVTVLSSKSSSKHPDIHYQCLYAVGGGPQSEAGGLPQHRSHTMECTNAILDYTLPKAQYWDDVTDAADQAARYYRALTPGPTDLLVFDIDETCISNIQEFRSRPDTNPDGSYEYSKAGWDAWVQSAQAPPIEAIRAVYVDAYKQGFSMAFITGRDEAAREATVKNLRQAGFGEQCQTAGEVVKRGDAPCWVALHMRGDEDSKKFASVYKPERRRWLVEEGYTIAGTFGDQFSDLNGAYPGRASWKLPNPMYYIL